MHRLSFAGPLLFALIVAITCALDHDGPIQANLVAGSPRVVIRSPEAGDAVFAGDALRLRLDVRGFVLALDPPNATERDNEGHVHVYLDSQRSEPIVDCALTDIHVSIPNDVAAGEHTLLVVLARPDHTDTDHRTEVSITIKAASDSAAR